MTKKMKDTRTQTMDKMSDEAKKRLTEFRSHFKIQLSQNPEINTTWYLLRFLRARDFDMKKAIKMFQDFIDFRKKKNYDRIKKMEKDEEFIREKYVRGYYHTDKIGRPIFVERVGFSKVNELLDTMSKDEVEDYFVQLYERLLFIQFPICSKIAGKRIDKCFGIMDLKKVHMIKMFNSKFRLFLKNVTNVSQNYYPELLGKLFIVNAGYFFKGVWNVVSVMLDDYTKDKIVICSGSGKKEIAKFVEKENLPDYFHGTCKDPLYIEPGPWKDYVEESYIKKTFFLQDRTPEYQYFYNDEERANLKKNEISTDNHTKHQEFYLSQMSEGNRNIKTVNSFVPPNINYSNYW